MNEKFKLSSLDNIAQKIIEQSQYSIFTLEGSMGMGKTTLVKALCKHWQAIDTVSSPTFSLVNEYKTETSNLIYHFDCYRLETTEEALDFGAEDYIESGAICLIEWPEIIKPLLPQNHHRILLSPVDENTRKITFI